MTERLEIARERSLLDVPFAHGALVVLGAVQSLATRRDLYPAEQEIETVRVTGSMWVGMRVERTLFHRVADDEENVGSVNARRPVAEPALVSGCEVRFVADIGAKLRGEHLLRLGEAQGRERNGELHRQLRPRLTRRRMFFCGTSHRADRRLVQRHDIPVVANETHL